MRSADIAREGLRLGDVSFRQVRALGFELAFGAEVAEGVWRRLGRGVCAVVLAGRRG